MSSIRQIRSRWFRPSSIPLIAAALLCAPPSLAATAEDTTVGARIKRIENGLLPPAVLEGAPLLTFTIAERMRLYRVPGLSIAVINGGEVEWAKGYGVIEQEGKGVDSHTLFQAASISKPVVATLALRSVEMGLVDLDAKLNDVLKSWKVPENQFTRQSPPTLRQLLAHRAGLTVHGFRGYTEGSPIPTVYEILDGVAPANNAAVRVDITPGTETRYSGGGYVLLQLLLTELHERPLRELVRRFVLEPAGMTDSAIAYPIDTELRINAASGHGKNGETIEGKYRVHPEIGAGGLWTTPTDLARWAIAIQKSYMGEKGSLLERETARAMLSAEGAYGLGPAIRVDPDEGVIFSHDGSNAGYFCRLIAWAERGRGVVVMLNGDDSTIVGELVRAVAREYGWPGPGVEVRRSVSLSPEQLARFVGRYELGPMNVEIRLLGDRLSAVMPDGRLQPLFAASATRIFNLEDDVVIDFDFDREGRFVRATVTVEGQRRGELTRR